MFLKAFLLGLSVASQVGPIAILCIRSTLVRGFSVGLSVAMGAAFADGIYAVIAAFGVYSLVYFLTGISFFLKFMGGLVIFIIGLKSFRSHTSILETSNTLKTSYLKNFSMTLFLTLANPLTIITFISITSLLETEGVPYFSLIISIGLFSGSLFWHLILVSGFSLVKNFITPLHFTLINYLSGAFLIGISLYMLFYSFKDTYF